MDYSNVAKKNDNDEYFAEAANDNVYDDSLTEEQVDLKAKKFSLFLNASNLRKTRQHDLVDGMEGMESKTMIDLIALLEIDRLNPKILHIDGDDLEDIAYKLSIRKHSTDTGLTTVLDDIFDELVELEAAGKTGSKRYKDLELKMESFAESAIRRSVLKFEKKISTTKAQIIKKKAEREKLRRAREAALETAENEKNREDEIEDDDTSTEELEQESEHNYEDLILARLLEGENIYNETDLVNNEQELEVAPVQTIVTPVDQNSTEKMTSEETGPDQSFSHQNNPYQPVSSTGNNFDRKEIEKSATKLGAAAALNTFAQAPSLDTDNNEGGFVKNNTNGVINARKEDLNTYPQITPSGYYDTKQDDQEVNAVDSESPHTPLPRIKKNDRSDMQRSHKIDNTRNVRSSTMPGNSYKNKTGSLRPTTDENFNQSYTEAGIQPQSLNDTKSTNQPDHKSVPQIDRSARVQHYPAQPTQDSQPEISRNRRDKSIKKLKDKQKRKLAKARRRVFRLTLWIWSIGFSSYLFFQLPFALMSNGLIGAGVVVGKATAFLGEFLGTYINPAVLGILAQLIIFFYGMFLLLGLIMVYKFFSFNPMGGRGAVLKMICILGAMIGYFMPIANLVPWFVPLTFAVLHQPK